MLLTMDQVPTLLTVPEVAKILRINPETVRNWARDGRLSPVPLPSRMLRFRRSDVEALLDDSTTEQVTS
jgi:excisionase family DNA binding protein